MPNTAEVTEEIKYVISVPMVAKTFKTTYNTQLEVYTYEDHKVTRTYTIKKNNIVEVKNKKCIYSIGPSQYSKGIPTGEDVIGYDGSAEKYMYFDSLGLAMASKVYLLRELKRTYMIEIGKLEARLAKNMPRGLEEQFKKLDNEYAEYFI